MSDTLPTASRVSDPGIRALYQLENRWQAWLDVEVALARTQAELGIIPAAAAEAIAAKAKLEHENSGRQRRRSDAAPTLSGASARTERN